MARLIMYVSHCLIYACFFIVNVRTNPLEVPATKAASCSDVEVQPTIPLKRFQDEYYYVDPIFTGNYYQAVEFCNRIDMKLVSIETKEENEFLWNYLQTLLGAEKYSFWTSGTTLATDQWNWLSTGNPLTYSNWLPNQPDNNKQNEHCLELKYDKASGDLKWNDLTCTNPLNLICESAPPTQCCLNTCSKVVH